MSQFEEKAREIWESLDLAYGAFGFEDEQRDANVSAISLALGEAFEAGKGESLRERAVVNEAPDGSSPFGLPSLSQAQICPRFMHDLHKSNRCHECSWEGEIGQYGLRPIQSGLSSDAFKEAAEDWAWEIVNEFVGEEHIVETYPGAALNLVQAIAGLVVEKAANSQSLDEEAQSADEVSAADQPASLTQEITSLRSQLETLKEALKPFAIEFDGKWADDCELTTWKGGGNIDRAMGLFTTTVGEHRRARAALNTLENADSASVTAEEASWAHR